MTKIRTYNELRHLKTFEERFDYLSLNGQVGETTYGFDRWINREFYRSVLWKQVRKLVIVRDNGCDLGIEGFELHRGLLIHHMNPMSPDDILHGSIKILDPEFLITTCQKTHNAIHYGDINLIPRAPIERKPGDTKLW